MTNGPMIDLTVDGGAIGSLVACGATADVSLRITAASWSPVERAFIYVNGESVRRIDIPAAQGTSFQTTLSLPLAGLAPIGIHLIFSKLLRVPLPAGLLPMPW